MEELSPTLTLKFGANESAGCAAKTLPRLTLSQSEVTYTGKALSHNPLIKPSVKFKL
jgi:hypothetical protein